MIVWYAVRSGLADYTAIYTWRTWLAGWYLRVLAQVMFFALIGTLLRSPERTWFLLVGNAILLAALEGIWALNLVNREREAGTLPLLAASPTSPVLVFAARGAYLVADGVLAALGALFVAGPVFGLPLPWPRSLLLVPLTVLVGASAYCAGVFLAGLLVRLRAVEAMVANLGVLALMALCGVNVPPPTSAAYALPLTNGLVAVRQVLAGDLGSAGRHAVAEALVGLCWLGLGVLTFQRLVQRGRRDGTLDFADQ
ncbi:MAG TPA: ABC transporter permease [Micromonosporaceae bacterium]|nr:ABC transporter permease [Micromonosporaceae bacterium]